jgi:hypothetical protein
MANYDEKVSFQQGSDTGTAEATSIVPISDAEVVWSGSTNRPIENLRQRTEILRRAVQDARYYQDYDRGLILRSEGLFSLEEVPSGSKKFRLHATAPLWVYPSLTPGTSCGGRWGGGRVFDGNNPYLFGSIPANGLTLTASAAFTGQRGYADGDTMATSTVLSVGANRITVDFVADATLATGVFQYVISQMPATKITIRYGTISGAPSFAALITSLNATAPVNTLLHAASAAASPSSLYISPRTGLIVQGAYDAEAHQVTVGQLDAFFTAYASEGYPNRLADGEGLAIGFPAGPVETYTAPYPKGGRRQSIFDLPTSRLGGAFNADNTTPVSGYSLFNTGYEPEKIPGAVPIGKLVRILLAPGVYATEFVFIDGTRVRLGADPVALGESGAMLTRLASRTGVTGASLIGYGGSDVWNPTVIAAPTTLPAGTIEEALDAVVTQLGGQGAGIGGARRVGFEQVTGASSPGNAPLNLTGTDTATGTVVKSVQIALSKALNEPSTVLNPGGGVNYRVSERGHRMHGPNPIEKIFSESETVGGGAQLVRAVLNEAPNARIGGQIEEQALALLKPFVWKNYDETLTVPSSFVAQAGAATNEVKFPAMTAAQAAVLQQNLALHSDLAQKAHCIVRLDGTAVGLDGYYFAGKLDYATTPPTLNISNLSNGSPNLSTINPTTTLTFFQSSLYGNDGEGNMARHTVGRNFSGAAAAYFGQGRIKQGYDEAGVVRHSETVLGAVWNDYASIGSVNGGLGATTSAGAPATLGQLRVTGLAGMSPSSEGRWLMITSASDLLLLGQWRIVYYGAPDTVDIEIPYPTLTAVTGIDWFELVDAARRTDNILIKEDADLLRGVEYGVTVDATVNHHHNTAYSFVEVSSLISAGARLDFLPGTTPTVTMVTLSTTGAYLDAAWVSSFVPTGYAPIGVFLECSLDLRLAAGGVPRDAWDLLIKTAPGTTWAATDSRVLFQETGYKQLTVGNQDVLKRVVCAFVRTNASGEAAFQADISSLTLEPSVSTLEVRPTAILCARQ